MIINMNQGQPGGVVPTGQGRKVNIDRAIRPAGVHYPTATELDASRDIRPAHSGVESSVCRQPGLRNDEAGVRLWTLAARGGARLASC